MSRLQKVLHRHVARAVRDFRMIGPGDRIMVGVSGGKDSYTLLHILRQMQRKAPFDFSVVAVTLDQGQPGFPADMLEAWYQEQGYEARVIYRDTYSVVLDKIPAGKTYCSLCSRLRRGILYSAAEDLGANKIALGHHRDDFLQTALLNLFYSGQIKSMAPYLRADDGRNTVIRPLLYCDEGDIAAFAAEQGFPIIPCNLCGSQDNMHRQKVKALIDQLHAENPVVKGNMLTALSNVRPTHLLDRDLWARLGMAPAGRDEGVDALGAARSERPVDLDREEVLPGVGQVLEG